ncbi:hypothetical protein Nepgr_025421 [Nepenthes gracilis]|uniref:Uncharacterized protein n=1 Tax=Nepenthes gracilis TaxID=150966 RepID=A0AAD3XZN2_NEPGR|nr:hypothetical protein Nepgr_025421 [Nepenthes gracilis]
MENVYVASLRNILAVEKIGEGTLADVSLIKYLSSAESRLYASSSVWKSLPFAVVTLVVPPQSMRKFLCLVKVGVVMVDVLAELTAVDATREREMRTKMRMVAYRDGDDLCLIFIFIFPWFFLLTQINKMMRTSKQREGKANVRLF